eukprot:TRINITY_DN8825_c0_g1_i1.p1 TRINITY_DN8825_c0_g1~~TRINITY_DN8825_c0_g1_i1.p1  ORF type:complete len:2558 (+),score=908.40 TRINITY_DN8825_c0_g1_i1:72-7676(+)
MPVTGVSPLGSPVLSPASGSAAPFASGGSPPPPGRSPARSPGRMRSPVGRSPGRGTGSPGSPGRPPRQSPGRGGSSPGSPRLRGSPRPGRGQPQQRSTWWDDRDPTLAVGSHVEVEVNAERLPGVVITEPTAENDFYRVKLETGRRCKVPRSRIHATWLADAGMVSPCSRASPSASSPRGPWSRNKPDGGSEAGPGQSSPWSPTGGRHGRPSPLGPLPAVQPLRPQPRGRQSGSGSQFAAAAEDGQRADGRRARGSSLGRRGTERGLKRMSSGAMTRRGTGLSRNSTGVTRRSSSFGASRKESGGSGSSGGAFLRQHSRRVGSMRRGSSLHAWRESSLSAIAGHRPSLVSQRRMSGKGIIDVKREVLVRTVKRETVNSSLGVIVEGLRVVSVDPDGPADRAKLAKLMSLAPEHTVIVDVNGHTIAEVEDLYAVFDDERRGDPLRVTFQAPIMIFIPSLFDDDDHTSGNCNNKFQGVEDLKWYHATQSFGKTRTRFNSLCAPLGLIDRTGWLRCKLVRVVDSRAFHYTVLAIILANAVCLAMDIPSTEDNDDIQDFLAGSEIFFLAAFTLEAVMKICAMGFVMHVDSYLRSSVAVTENEGLHKDMRIAAVQQSGGDVGASDLECEWEWNWWNIIDFAIVLVAWAGLHPDVANVSIVRAVRVLRPLRALHRVEGLQTLLKALLSALGPLANVMVMLLFFMVIFLIMGVLFWEGKWHQRCTLSEQDTAAYLSTADAASFATAKELGVVSWTGAGPPPGSYSSLWNAGEWILANVTHACTTSAHGAHCNANDIGFAGPSTCQNSGWCRSRFLNFDNSLSAALLVFKIISLDDWPDDLKVAQDTTGQVAFIYFLALTLIGSYFTMNLVLAILCGDFSRQRMLLKAERQRKKQRELRGEHHKTYTYAVKCSTVHFSFMRLVISIYGSRSAMWRPREYRNQGNREENVKLKVLEAFRHVSPLNKTPGSPDWRSPLGSSGGILSPAERSGHSAQAQGEGPAAPVQPQQLTITALRTSSAGSAPARITPLLTPAVAGLSSSDAPLVNPDDVVMLPQTLCMPAPPSDGPVAPAALNGHAASAAPGEGLAPGSEPLRRVTSRGKEVAFAPDLANGRSQTEPRGGHHPCLSAALIGRTLETIKVDEEEGGTSSSRRSSHGEQEECDSSSGTPPQASPRVQWLPRRGSVVPPHLRSPEGLLGGPGGDEAEDEDERSDSPEMIEAAVMEVAAAAAVVLGGAAASAAVARVAGRWSRLRCRVRLLVESTPFKAFISAVIAFNVLVMCIDHHGVDRSLERFIELTSFVCNIIFVLEMLLKWLGLGFWYRRADGKADGYFASGWNVFDCLLVCLAIPDLATAFRDTSGGPSSELTALRAFRAFRVTRVLRRFKSLQRVIKLIRVSMASAAYLSLIMVLFIFIYTILGIQLFSGSFPGPDSERNNFSSLWEAAITVFTIITGEGWAHAMAVAMDVTSPAACLYFISLFSLGNYIFMNLFIALLIDKFASMQLTIDGGVDPNQHPDEEVLDEDQVIMEDIDAATSACGSMSSPAGTGLGSFSPDSPFVTSGDSLVAATGAVAAALAVGAIVVGEVPSELMRMTCADWDDDNPEDKEAAKRQANPNLFGVSLNLFPPTNEMRICLARMVYHKAFDWAVVSIIALNTLTMALSGLWLRDYPKLERTIEISEYVFIALFVVEAAIKIVVLGFVGDCEPLRKQETEYQAEPAEDRAGSAATNTSTSEEVEESEEEVLEDIVAADDYCDSEAMSVHAAEPAEDERPYLRLIWNRLDLFVVVTAVLGLFVPFFTIFRSLRSVRLIIRLKNVKVVVKALVRAIPGIANVMVVTGFAFLVFAILGVQLFKGKLYSCSDPEVEFKDQCVGNFSIGNCSGLDEAACAASAYCRSHDGICVSEIPPMDIWGNAPRGTNLTRAWVNSRFHYDHVGESFLSLFAVALGERWPTIMWNGVDARSDTISVKHPNSLNSNPAFSIYFIIFVVVGNFFALNLFVGLLIDQFARQKRLQDRKRFGSHASVFVTDDQHYWIAASKALRRIGLQCRPQPPAGEGCLPDLRRHIFRLVGHPLFDRMIMLAIAANTVFMALRHHNQSDGYTRMQDIANIVFITIFAIEAALKITAWSRLYFSDNWNCFDFALVLLSFGGLAVSARQVSVFRILRVARVLRLMRKAKGLCSLFETLYYSSPALLNISLLLLTIYFNFAVMGVQLFGDVGNRDHFDKWLNFENVGNAMIALYVISSTEKWSDLMESSYLDEAGCEGLGSCGRSRPTSVAYFLSFMVIGSVVTINLFITVVLDNFVPADDEDGWNGRDGIFEKLHAFTEVWNERDTTAEGVLDANAFIELLKDPRLVPPVRIITHPSESSLETTTRIARHLRALAVPNPDSDRVYIPVNRKTLDSGEKVNQVRYWDCLVAIARRCSREEVLRRFKLGLPPSDQSAVEHELDWLIRWVLLRGWHWRNGGDGGAISHFTVFHYHAANSLKTNWQKLRSDKRQKRAAKFAAAACAVVAVAAGQLPYEPASVPRSPHLTSCASSSSASSAAR